MALAFHRSGEHPLEARVASGSELPAGPKVRKIELKRFKNPGRRLWIALACLVAVGFYPAMMVVSSQVGDRNLSGIVDQTRWTSRWAGSAAGLIERQYTDLGWTPDAHWLSPAAHLTAKPAFQQALSSAVGEYVALMAEMSGEASAEGSDRDLIAASRLNTASSNVAQLHAGRQALVSYDRRQRRGGGADRLADKQARQIELIRIWALEGRRDIARLTDRSPPGVVSRDATVAVYSAKARAQAAFVFLEAMEISQDADLTDARRRALEAWGDAARFRPLLVLNGSSEGSVWGNHAVSMGFLLVEAESATADLLASFRSREGEAMIVSSAEAIPDTAVN